MQKRNYGIDCLRMVSMFMVVILHLLGKGGILNNAAVYSSEYWGAWFLEIAAYSAVNCYALISGFVMYNSNAKISNIIKIWLQIIFYEIIIMIISYIVDSNSFNFENIVNIIFPITKKQYWYLSAYFGMYIFVPVLNLAINQFSRKKCKLLILCAICIMAVLPKVLLSDPYVLNGGYSTIWLCILYLAGGYFHKYAVFDKMSKKAAIGGFWMMVIITFLSKVILEHVHINEQQLGGLFISYISPTIIVAALFLLTFFSKLKLEKRMQKLIMYFAPASLGVYIIHEQSWISGKYIKEFTIRFLNGNCVLMLLKVLVYAMGVYIICSVIDILRIKLFSLLKVNNLCGWFSSKLKEWGMKWL